MKHGAYIIFCRQIKDEDDFLLSQIDDTELLTVVIIKLFV